jgi:LacI family transcriptional regulator
VALIVEAAQASGRDLLRGIAHYLRGEGPWSILQEPGDPARTVPSWLKGWEGDGVIAQVSSRALARALAALSVPVVDAAGALADSGFPVVRGDDTAIGQRGADHLLERGLQHFGFCGLEAVGWSARRRAAFAAAIGGSVRTLDVPRRMIRDLSGGPLAEKLAAWIEGLPKPAGVMLACDALGPVVLQACRRVQRDVPNEVSVLGVDNDDVLCLLTDPPLSSVRIDHERIGREAARLLDQMLKGGLPPAEPICLPPDGVAARASTRTRLIADPEVAAAVRYIREHAAEGILVRDVFRHVSVSPSVLQKRFREQLGCSPHEEIIRVRLERAQELLRETDLPLPAVAQKSGFRHADYLGAVFRARLRITPHRYRQEQRREAGSGPEIETLPG